MNVNNEIRIVNGGGIPNTHLNYLNGGVNWISGTTNFRDGNIYSDGNIASKTAVIASAPERGSVNIRSDGRGNNAGVIEFKKENGKRKSFIGWGDNDDNTVLFADESPGFTTNKNFNVGQNLNVGGTLCLGNTCLTEG